MAWFDWLARRAQRRADGRRGWRGQQAWDALVRDCGRGDARAIGAVWRMWTLRPDDEVWTAMQGWLDPQVMARDALTAAADPDRDVESRVAIGQFCAGHMLIPDNPVECVLFYSMTGQLEQRQALDPDGALLATAYRSADEATRVALRRMMTGAGDLDLVRAIADRPGRVPRGPEFEYLVTQLASAGEWAQLWRFVTGASVQDAVRAAKRFDGWHPPGGPARDLFEHLVKADPDLVDSLIAAAAVTQFAGSYPTQLSIAPDSSQIAIGTVDGTTVYELPSGRIVAFYPGPGYRTMLLLGGSAVVGDAKKDAQRMVYCSPDGRFRELKSEEACEFLGRIPGGFMLAHYWDLSFWTVNGRISRWVTGDDLSLGKYPSMSVVATEPRTGRFVVNDRTGGVPELIMYDLDLTMLARVRHEHYGSGMFCGPDRFVTWNYLDEDRMVRVFRRENDDLVLAAHTGPAEVMSAWPQRNLLAVKRTDGMVWLDADTLGEVRPPPLFPRTEAYRMSISDDETLAAIVPAGTGVVAVHDLRLLRIADLANIPMADTRPEDARVLDALTSGRSNPPAVEVIRACFKYGYGSEIALGAGFTRHRDDDIALGGSA